MSKQFITIDEEVTPQGGIKRRDFLKCAAIGAVGASVATMFGCSPAAEGAKSEGAGDMPQAEAKAPEAPAAPAASGGRIDPLTSDALMQQVLEESEVTGDVVMSDGTVIPEIYVRMRNRINRIGKGIGSNPAKNSWDMIMYLFSEEDAEHYLEMPMHEFFTAANYAVLSGRSEEECLEILEDMADRCLIFRVRRAGLPYFLLLPHVNGFWEFYELKLAYESGDPYNTQPGGPIAEFNQQGIMADTNDYDLTFPLFRSYPISLDVIEGDAFEPWQDWRALIKRNKTITVSPCQCRTMWKALEVDYPEDHPIRTCLSLGEMAEYFIENGIGDQITQDEAIAVVEDAIAHGMVPESVCAQNADIICCCHGDSCGNLKGYLAAGGGNCSTYFSAYTLKYDADKCIGCGKCVDICPMHSVTITDGKCVMDELCVRCGHCVEVCPQSARILTPTEGYPELPNEYIDCNRYFAKDRMARGYTKDFTDTKLEVEA